MNYIDEKWFTQVYTEKYSKIVLFLSMFSGSIYLEDGIILVAMIGFFSGL